MTSLIAQSVQSETVSEVVPVQVPVGHVLSRTMYEVAMQGQHCWCSHGNRIEMDDAGVLHSRCCMCDATQLQRCWQRFLDTPASSPDQVLIALAGLVWGIEDVVSEVLSIPWLLVDAAQVQANHWIMARTALGKLLS